MKSKKPILLVEDDQVDQMTVKRALAEINITNRLDILSNGEEALKFLRDPANQKPGLILLDLNMPRMNGIELLRLLKQDDALKIIPVIILTTSHEEWERVESFRLSAAGYMIKPVDYRQFVEVIKTINMYWTISEVPE